jgi:hypothetical protein
MTTSMMLAHTRSMSTEDAAGRQAIGIWYRTVWWAVDELVAKLTPEQLRKLRVRAGEHLAAILTTTFLRTPPPRSTSRAASTCGLTFLGHRNPVQREFSRHGRQPQHSR